MHELIQQLKNYAELRLELLKISAAETIINATSSLFIKILVFVIFIAFLITLEVSVGLYLRKYFNDWSTGFFWITAFNFLALIIVLLFRRKITMLIQDGLTKYLSKNEI